MMKALGDRIKSLRLAKKYTQEQIAELLGISRQKYARIENGDNSISLDTLSKLAKVFDVTVHDITCVLDESPSVAFRAGDDEVALRLHTQPHLERAGGVGIAHHAAGEHVHAVHHAAVEVQALIADAQQLHDGQQRVGPHLVHRAARLRRVELTQRPVVVPQLRERGLDVDHLTDHATLDHHHQMVERRTVRRLVRLHQDEPLRLGEAVELNGLLLLQHHRRLAQHVAASLQGTADVAGVGEMGRSDVHGIDGGCAGGKSTVARLLKAVYGAAVIPMTYTFDDAVPVGIWNREACVDFRAVREAFSMQ